MNNGLIHIKKRYDADEREYDDIEDLKIYFDSTSGQYKHKFHCSECNKELDCFCFNDLWDAVYEVEFQGMQCEKCFVELNISDYLFEDEDMQDIIDMNECTDIRTKIKCIEMIGDGSLYPKATQEYKFQRLSDFEHEIKDVTKNLSESTISALLNYLNENADFDFSGSACVS